MNIELGKKYLCNYGDNNSIWEVVTVERAIRKKQGVYEIKLSNDKLANAYGHQLHAMEDGVLSIPPGTYNRIIASGCGIHTLKCEGVHVEIFNCADNRIDTLEGGPESASRYDCRNNALKTLVGCPRVLDNLRCEGNPLVSLKGGPTTVGVFVIPLKYLESLRYLPQVTEQLTLDKAGVSRPALLLAMIIKGGGKIAIGYSLGHGRDSWGEYDDKITPLETGVFRAKLEMRTTMWKAFAHL